MRCYCIQHHGSENTWGLRRLVWNQRIVSIIVVGCGSRYLLGARSLYLCNIYVWFAVTPGFACAAGSTTPTAAVCPTGKYSLQGYGECVVCSSGSFGNSTMLTTPGCSGLCPAGLYGSLTGLTTSSCSGMCTAGYSCVAGSISSMAYTCRPGTYSLSGAASCSSCSLGLYGDVAALPTAACSGPCPAGRYAAAVALNTSDCSGPCAAGYFCDVASLNATVHACGNVSR
jgi:hypothetical protein